MTADSEGWRPMSGIFEKLRQAANDTADHLTSMISELDHQIAQKMERELTFMQRFQ